MAFTEEQLDLIYSRAHRAKVSAFAGSGKTLTAVGYCKARPNSRILYMVFNNAAQRDAMGRFPSNVTPKTINAIAYAVFGRIYRHKHTNNLQASDVRAAVDPVGEMNYRSLMLIAETVRHFMISSEISITVEHARKAIPEGESLQPERLLAAAQRLWSSMTDPERRDVRITHDGYVKLLHQSSPDFSQQFDILIVDEAQDVNQVTLAIIEAQTIPVVMIGDPHQSIYRFRGAVAAMSSFQADQEFALTYSFRFGCQSATLANQLLYRYKQEDEILIGAGPDTLITSEVDTGRPYMKIHRTVAQTVQSAIDAVSEGKTISWVGGADSYGLRQLRDLYWLYSGQHSAIQDYRMKKEFPSYDHYRAMSRATNNGEMTRLSKMVEDYGQDTVVLLDAIQANTVDPGLAHVNLTTAHRSKGLQAERVQLAEDFPVLTSSKLTNESLQDEANLLYVAITRGMQAMGVPDAIRAQIASAA